MDAEIRRDEHRYTRHFAARPRHTMQVDYYVYEHDLRTRVVPAGQQRASARLSGAAAATVG